MGIGGLGVVVYFLGKKNSLRSDTFFLAEINHHPQTAANTLPFVWLKEKAGSDWVAMP
ncbi:hypothetical protein [Marinobacter panjinensis]|uniref:hypothetical protein n=1 Tax=Marinobacter panjinensis TaxID=2576384 RepID=UPI001485308A|nr:hypothetical protein [Marinobacter panjinensis]MCR8914110.1 hypothetical protein [Marinobacter panjinensis]